MIGTRVYFTSILMQQNSPLLSHRVSQLPPPYSGPNRLLLPFRSPSALLLIRRSGPAQALLRHQAACSGTLLLSVRHLDRDWSSCRVDFVNFRRWRLGGSILVSRPSRTGVSPMLTLLSLSSRTFTRALQCCNLVYMHSVCPAHFPRSFALSLSTFVSLFVKKRPLTLSLCLLASPSACLDDHYSFLYSTLVKLCSPSLSSFRYSKCLRKKLPRITSSELERKAP